MKFAVFGLFLVVAGEPLASFLSSEAPANYKKVWQVIKTSRIEEQLAQAGDSAWVIVLPEDKTFKNDVLKAALKSSDSAQDFVMKAVMSVGTSPKSFKQFVELAKNEEILTLSGSLVKFKKTTPYLHAPEESSGGFEKKGTPIKVNKKPKFILDDATIFQLLKIPNKF